MLNIYGISNEVEKEIRSRDKKCVYCHILLKPYPHTKGAPMDKATIEHFSDPTLNDSAVALAICCGSCNSSRGALTLLDWFKTTYCEDKNINEKTVAEPVKKYLRLEAFIARQNWTFAKTMLDIPHSYIVRDSLPESDKEIFDEFNVLINKNGYTEEFKSKKYKYLNIDNFKYWIMDNILNRAKIKR